MLLTCRNCSSNVQDWASLFRDEVGEWTSAPRPPDIGGVSPERLDFGDKSVATDCLQFAVVSDTARLDGDCWDRSCCCWRGLWCIGDGCTDRPGCWYTRCWSIGAISLEPEANCLASWLSVSRSSRFENNKTKIFYNEFGL